MPSSNLAFKFHLNCPNEFVDQPSITIFSERYFFGSRESGKTKCTKRAGANIKPLLQQNTTKDDTSA